MALSLLVQVIVSVCRFDSRVSNDEIDWAIELLFTISKQNDDTDEKRHTTRDSLPKHHLHQLYPLSIHYPC